MEIFGVFGDYPSGMTQIEAEPGQVIGHVQTDTFCESCGYNLHTQAVVRDERLGILICRCPECGRWAAAGRFTSASRVWLNRVGIALLGGWILFLLILFALTSLFLGMIAYGHLMEDTEYEAIQNPVVNRPGQFYSSYRYKLREPIKRPGGNDQDSEWERRRQFERFLIDGVTALLGLVTGAMFSVLLWHVKGWKRALALLPATLGCGWAAVVWHTDPMTVLVRGWGVRQLALWWAVECVAIGIGLLVGRPIARGALHILLPPKLRQHLAFLWTTDGKRLSA